MTRQQPDTMSLRIWIVVLLLFLTGSFFAFILPEWLPAGRWNAVGNLGSSLMTAGLLVLIVERITTREIIRRQKRQLEDSLGEISLRTYGFETVTHAAPYEQIVDDLATSNHLTIVQTWCPQIKRVLDKSESLIRRGGTVDIFLLNPTSRMAAVRSEDLLEPPEYVTNKILTDTSTIRLQYKRLDSCLGHQIDLSSKFRLFYYDSLPTCAIYKTDQRIALSLYWHGRQSDDCANVILRSRGKAAFLINEQIAMLRQNATPVDLDPPVSDLFAIPAM